MNDLDRKVAELLGWGLAVPPGSCLPVTDPMETRTPYFHYTPSTNIQQAMELVQDENFVLYSGWTCHLGDPPKSDFSGMGCCYECCGGCEHCYAVTGAGETAAEALVKAWISYKESK